MSTELTTAKNALEGFATHLETFWTTQPLHEAIGGWNMVPIGTRDMAARVRRLAARLDEFDDGQLTSDQQSKLALIPKNVAWFQDNAVPQIRSGNAPVVLANFDYLLTDMEQLFPEVCSLDWEDVSGSSLVPKNLARRLRNLESAISRLEPRTENLDGQLKAIADAHHAALDLPTDLQSLQEARDEIRSRADDVKLISDEVAKAANDSSENAKKIEEKDAEVNRLIANIEAAYSAATTKGLAASFTERANNLTYSTRYWVGMLAVSLLVGAFIGYYRLEAFQDVADKNGISTQVLWINAAMSLLAIAAPVWFSWLATRQIGQRFRLAEDYAFKASVARAYEGYRKEAARLDPELEARLFSSALDRLDEAPLRFVSTEEHGSPYESLLASAGFQKALEKVPSLREALAALVDRAGGTRSPDARMVPLPLREASGEETA